MKRKNWTIMLVVACIFIGYFALDTGTLRGGTLLVLGGLIAGRYLGPRRRGTRE